MKETIRKRLLYANLFQEGTLNVSAISLNGTDKVPSKPPISSKLPKTSTMGRSRHSTSGRTAEKAVASQHIKIDSAAVQGPSRYAPLTVETSDDMANQSQLRAFLMPPPLAGTANWGIPPPAGRSCDIELEAKLRRFTELKAQDVHFNQSLMSNKSFRNPHLYAKLVEFVEVDEGATNFPREQWDPHVFQKNWLAESIAEAQKLKYERLQTSQAPGKRSRIDFMPGSNSRDEKTRSNERHENTQSTNGALDNRARWAGEGPTKKGKTSQRSDRH